MKSSRKTDNRRVEYADSDSDYTPSDTETSSSGSTEDECSRNSCSECSFEKVGYAGQPERGGNHCEAAHADAKVVQPEGGSVKCEATHANANIVQPDCGSDQCEVAHANAKQKRKRRCID